MCRVRQAAASGASQARPWASRFFLLGGAHGSFGQSLPQHHLFSLWGMYHIRVRSIEQRFRERTLAAEKLQRSVAYLSEAQSISHTGSFGWNVSSGEIFWSEETYQIFEHDRAVKPTLELVFQRIHPDDRDLVQQTLDHATEAKENFDLEHRLLRVI